MYRHLIFKIILLSITLNSLEAVANCSEHKINQKQTINYSHRESLSKVSMKFNITKLNSHLYEIGVNPKMINRPHIVMKHIKECYERVNPYIRSKSLVHLRFVIDKSAPEIIIDDKALFQYRAHSRSFNEHTSCSTIIHESFHWLGLVDEYYDHDFPKRHVNKSLSIMSNQSQHVDFYLPKYELKGCLDPVGLNSWDHYRDLSIQCFKLKQKAFYANISVAQLQIGEAISSFNTALNEPVPRVPLPKGQSELLFVSKLILPKLSAGFLNNNQFNSIIYPNCKARNSNYYKCAQSAYSNGQQNENCNSRSYFY